MKKQTKQAKVDYDIGIIGAGFAGLGLAIRLKQEGKRSFVLLERAEQVGGTWRDNIYPGCACDVPSHLYSYSFELNPTWTKTYSGQPEILKYIIECKDKYNLDQHIHYNTHFSTATFDEDSLTWLITATNGNTWRVKTVVAALGPLNVPKIPNFKGKDLFEGPQFHSSNWQEEVELEGKRVAVVGTGASAIQIVPEIADKVEQLTVFQRSAPWIFPRNNRTIRKARQEEFKRSPFKQRLKRLKAFLFMESQGRALFNDNWIRKLSKQMAEDFLEKEVPDPILRDKLRPNYTIGCKRRLISDDYYAALNKPQVHLETTPIQEMTPQGIIDEQGHLHEFDVIIYATGFQVVDYGARNLEVKGVNGASLFEEWGKDVPEAYYGTVVADYPGFFFLVGPNTGLGHNSIVYMMEAQFNFVLDYWKHLDRLPKGSLLNLKNKAQETFNKRIQKELSTMVWSTGSCSSWYLSDTGKNSTLWPGSPMVFYKETKQIRRRDFEKLSL
jgi:cation diffusion facilitator CzcD-associated flavoprotein CzcO